MQLQKKTFSKFGCNLPAMYSQKNTNTEADLGTKKHSVFKLMNRRWSRITDLISAPDEKVFECRASSSGFGREHVMRTHRIIAVFFVLCTSEFGCSFGHKSFVVLCHSRRPRLHLSRVHGAMASFGRMDIVLLLPLLNFNRVFIAKTLEERLLFHCRWFPYTLCSFSAGHAGHHTLQEWTQFTNARENTTIPWWTSEISHRPSPFLHSSKDEF